MMGRVLKTGVSAIVMLFASAQAGAAVLTYTDAVNLTPTNWFESLEFPRFDPALGTLNEVQLSLEGFFETTLTVKNTGNSDARGRARTEVTLSVQDAGGSLIAQQIELFSTPPFAFSGLAAGQSVTSGKLNRSGNSNESYSLPDVLAAFSGSGNISLPASALAEATITVSSGNAEATQVTSASLDGQVRYIYAPVPEPGSAAMMALGVIAMAGFGLRRRRLI